MREVAMGNLMLSRNAKQSIVVVVGGEIIAKVTVTEIRGVKVRLGLEAEETIKFYRNEVWERMQEEAKNVGTTGIEPSGTGSTPS